jgi:hypothetical protein
MVFPVCPSYPHGEEAENATGPLKARESLPFPLEDRNHRGMEWIGIAKHLARVLATEIRKFWSVLCSPGSIRCSRPLPLIGKAVPLEKAATDDLCDLGFV